MADITITEGDTLEVDYSLENTGDGTGTFDPRLLVQGVQEDQDTGITLDPAQTAAGTLSWPTEDGDAVTDALAEAVTDDTSDSITVTVENAIPDSVVDNFEESLYEDVGNTLSSYYEVTGTPSSLSDVATRQTSTVVEGTYALELDAGNGEIHSHSGLNYYPKAGNTIEWRHRITGDDRTKFGVFLTNGSEDTTGYAVRIRPNNNALTTGLGSATTELDSNGYSTPKDEWLRVVMDTTKGGGAIDVTVYNSSNTQLFTLSATNNNYTSGGIGFHTSSGGSNTTYFDNVQVI